MFFFQRERLGGTVSLEGGRTPARVELLTDGNRRRLRATLSDGLVLTADADQPWAWITPVSTLLAAYREAHPEVSREEAVRKIQAYLALRDSLDRPFSSLPASRFSPRAFLEAAAGRPLPEFAASLVPEIDAGRVRPFVEAQVRARGLLTKLGAGFLKNVWEGGLMLSLVSKGAGALAGLCGLHSSTYKMLQEIQQQLNQIAQQATDIQQQLDNVQNQSALNTLKSNIAPALANVTNYSNVQVLASAALVPAVGASPTAATYIPFSTASAFQSNTNLVAWFNALNQNDALNDATAILANTLGTGQATNQGNLCTGWAEVYAKPFGSGLNSYASYANGTNWPFFYDFRSDVAVTQSLANTTGGYSLDVLMAANMLRESANQQLASNSKSPAGNLTAAETALNGYQLPQSVGGGLGPTGTLSSNGLAALSKRMLQQAPLAFLGGESPINGTVWAAVADAEDVAGTTGAGHLNGTLWAASGFECTDSGDGTPENTTPVEYLGYYGINGWNQWYYPSNSEVQQLFARAKWIAENDPNRPSDSNQYIAFGLHKLGLISDAAYSHAQKDSGYVEVYYDFENTGQGGQSGLHMQVLRSDGNSYDNGLVTIVDSSGTPYVALKPQDGHLAVALLVRPFPGAPNVAQATSVPASVQNSQTAQKLAGSPFFATDLPLAANFVPDEVVLQQDAANPLQLRAYGLWVAGQANPPKSYTTPWTVAYHYYGSATYNLNYQNPPSANCIYYTELTDIVEWLSSSTTSVEVTNYPPPAVTVQGATLSGLTATVCVENATVSGSSLSGGNIIFGSGTAGSLSGGTAYNGLNPAGPFPSPSPIPIAEGTLTAGTLTGAVTNTLFTTAAVRAGTITNGTVTGGTAQNAQVAIPTADDAMAGTLVVHNSVPVTISASLLTSPSTVATAQGGPNSQAAKAQFVSGTLALTPPPAATGIASLIIAPNYATVTSNTTTGGGQIPFFVTGLDNDGTAQPLETDPATTFQVFLLTDGTTPAAAPQLFFRNAANGGNAGLANVLQVPPGFAGYVAVKATHSGKSAWAFLNLSF